MSDNYDEIDVELDWDLADPDNEDIPFAFEQESEEEFSKCNACYGTGMDRELDVDCMVCYGEGWL